jgi:hypothetical protein
MELTKPDEDSRGAKLTLDAKRMRHIEDLFTAELQFRLASAVDLAVTLDTQPLDLPTEWTHGRQTVGYDEIAVRQDQAEYAAWNLHQSATFLMAVAMKDAIRAMVTDPKNSSDHNVRAAYQISRLIRNAFAHGPFRPKWSIDPNCRNTVFQVDDVISLDTTSLDGKPFEWQDYGGPLALFRLCRFVRKEILKDTIARTIPAPPQETELIQFGDLILKRIDKIPDAATSIEPRQLPNGDVDLGEGYGIRSAIEEGKN